MGIDLLQNIMNMAFEIAKNNSNFNNKPIQPEQIGLIYHELLEHFNIHIDVDNYDSLVENDREIEYSADIDFEHKEICNCIICCEGRQSSKQNDIISKHEIHKIEFQISPLRPEDYIDDEDDDDDDFDD